MSESSYIERIKNYSSSRRLRFGLILAIFSVVLVWTFRYNISGLNYAIDGRHPVGLTPAACRNSALDIHNKGIIGDKVAVLIENRSSPKLVPLVLHFQSILGPEWPIVLFLSSDLLDIESPALRREIARGNIEIRELPKDVLFNHQWEVSEFLIRPWLWEELAPAKHVLLFQMDSILCSTSKYTIDDFLEYDLVGAPIQYLPSLGSGYNGGLSLRNRELILRITKEEDWEADKKAGPPETWNNPIFPENDHQPHDVYEDQWFFRKAVDYGANLPDFDTANTFSSETERIQGSFGYHKPDESVLEWCPEASLIMAEHFPGV